MRHLQEVWWKSVGARLIENGFKFLWRISLGVVVTNWLIEKAVDAERHSDKVIKMNVIIGDAVWEVASYYCPLTGRSTTEREEFYE